MKAVGTARYLLLALVVVPVLACRGALTGPGRSTAVAAVTAAPTATVMPGAVTAAPTIAAAATEPAQDTAGPAPTATAIVLGEPPRALTRYAIDADKHPLAVCNDGTRPVFYYRRGSGSGSDKWVLWFKGGGACYDGATCAGRDADLLSTTPWTRREIGNQGILSARPEQNPDFYNWHHVFMVYCTSDLWSGTRAEPDPETGFYFRGHYVANAIVDALMDAEIIGRPTLDEASQVLLTGSSAGAAGLRRNVDRLAEQLAWADVRAASDAALTYVVNPAFEAQAEAISLKQYEVWQPVLDASCTAAHTDTPWVCGESVRLIEAGHIATPLFVRHDLVDPLSLSNQALEPQNPAHRGMIMAFAEQVGGLLRGQPGAYGTWARQHVMIETEHFNQYQVDGLTFAHVLGNWYFEREGPKVVVEQAPR